MHVVLLKTVALMIFAKCQARAQKVGAPACNKKEQDKNNEQNSAYSSLRLRRILLGKLSRQKN
jgi:hypothetical protein